MKQFNAVSPISNEDTNALPVKEFDAAIKFYETVLGFAVVTRDSNSATLTRDDVQIGLIQKDDHKADEAGSCYFSISDVEALRHELDGEGGELGQFRIDEYGGKHYRVFFLRESENGYCFCFGQAL
jgi:lactoylglutathione lyase